MSNQPMFNRRHYEKIANELNWCYRDNVNANTVLEVASMLSIMFREDNPNFDRDKFYKAVRGE